MKPIHLIVASLVVLAMAGCSKKEETTTPMEQSSESATQSGTGAMEPAGEAAQQSGESTQMQEPAEPAQ